MTDKLTAKSFELSSSEIALVYTRKKVTLLVLGKPKWPKKKNKILRYLLLTYSTLHNMYIEKLSTCIRKSTVVMVEDLRFTVHTVKNVTGLVIPFKKGDILI